MRTNAHPFCLVRSIQRQVRDAWYIAVYFGIAMIVSVVSSAGTRDAERWSEGNRHDRLSQLGPIRVLEDAEHYSPQQRDAAVLADGASLANFGKERFRIERRPLLDHHGHEVLNSRVVGPPSGLSGPDFHHGSDR